MGHTLRVKVCLLWLPVCLSEQGKFWESGRVCAGSLVFKWITKSDVLWQISCKDSVFESGGDNKAFVKLQRSMLMDTHWTHCAADSLRCGAAVWCHQQTPFQCQLESVGVWIIQMNSTLHKGLLHESWKKHTSGTQAFLSIGSIHEAAAVSPSDSSSLSVYPSTVCSGPLPNFWGVCCCFQTFCRIVGCGFSQNPIYFMAFLPHSCNEVKKQAEN